MTAPYATCCRCDTDLYPRLARRTPEGWVCAHCCECGGRLSRQSRTGLCRSCNLTRLATDKRKANANEREGSPCRRCSLPTVRQDGLCRDCRDVLADLGEMERWAA